MEKWSDKYLFGLLLLTIVVFFLLAKFLFPFDADNPFAVEFETSAVFKDSESKKTQILFDDLNQSLMTLKKMGELFNAGLVQLQKTRQDCEEIKDPIVCDDFLVKEQRLKTLGNVVLSEHHHLARLIDKIRLLTALQEPVLNIHEEPLDVND